MGDSIYNWPVAVVYVRICTGVFLTKQMKTLATQGSCQGSGSEKDFSWSMTSGRTSFCVVARCLWKPASKQVKGQTCLGISPNSSNEAWGCQLQRGAPVYGTHLSEGPAAACCRCRRRHTTSSCWPAEALEPDLQDSSEAEQSRDKLNLEIRRKSFPWGQAGNGEDLMFCRVIAAAELLDKLYEFLKRAKDRCIIARVGAKIQLRNGTSSRFFDAYSSSFCSEVCRRLCRSPSCECVSSWCIFPITKVTRNCSSGIWNTSCTTWAWSTRNTWCPWMLVSTQYPSHCYRPLLSALSLISTIYTWKLQARSPFEREIVLQEKKN